MIHFLVYQQEEKETLDKKLKSCVDKLMIIKDRQKQLKAQIKQDEDGSNKEKQKNPEPSPPDVEVPTKNEVIEVPKPEPQVPSVGKKRGPAEAGMDDEQEENEDLGTGGHILQPVVVTDELRKEHFLLALGLVTKAALSELQNRKYTRKRRTTANPHFSNAAIEAKRINQMENAARRAKKREMVALRTRQASARKEEPVAEPQAPKTATGKKLLNGTGPKVSLDCVLCNDKCDADPDSVMFCVDCRCLFHSTCGSSVEEISISGVVPCPKCDRKMDIGQELSSNEAMMETIKRTKTGKKLKTAKILETVSLNRENGVTKVDISTHYEAKRTELIQLIEKKDTLVKEWADRKNKLDSLQTTLKTAKDKSCRLSGDRHQLSNSIEKLVGFIKSVQIWKDIIDEDNAAQKAAKGTTSEVHQSHISIVAVEKREPITYGKENAGLKKKTTNGSTLLVQNVKGVVHPNGVNGSNNAPKAQLANGKSSDKPADHRTESQLSPSGPVPTCSMTVKLRPAPDEDETNAAIASIQTVILQPVEPRS